MKNFRNVLASIMLCSSVSVMADTGVFVGVVYDFGSGTRASSGLGLSAKVVSDDEEDKAVGAVGLSYFPQAANKLGVDVSIGYTFDNGLVTLGYDILNKQPQMGLGYMDTDDGSTSSPAPAPVDEGDGGGDGDGGVYGDGIGLN